jgi:hypothetical protein
MGSQGTTRKLILKFVVYFGIEAYHEVNYNGSGYVPAAGLRTVSQRTVIMLQCEEAEPAAVAVFGTCRI